ncbi:MAG: hypothetical protein ABIN18_29760 [Pseudomonadota bacterium]
MSTIKVYIDINAISNFAQLSTSDEVISLVHKQGCEPIISDTVVQELLRHRDSSFRNLIGKFIVDLLQDRPILAPLAYQIHCSSIDFAEGQKTFRPYETKKSDWVKDLLIDSDRLTMDDITKLDHERGYEADSWEKMHTKGRVELQKLITKTGQVPSINDWLDLMNSDFVRDLIGGIVASEALPKIRGDEQRFIDWNPLLQCFLEQLLLAIYRHTVEPPTAASKKGPGWVDYSHGAFAGLVHVFVTDDKRFFRALKQHIQLFPKWKYLIFKHTQIKEVLESGQDFENSDVEKRIQPLPSRE